MPQPSDDHPGSKTMSHTELNPLLNPLLADNMGRWAEVYFNNPPDRRDHAVLELLHQLEAEKVTRQAAPGMDVQVHRATVQCARCGRMNPASHKFCGICGATLAPAGEQSPEADMEPASVDEPPTAQDLRRVYEDRVTHTNTNSLSLFQNVPGNYGDYEDEQWDYEPTPSHPYRYYVGMVLAIILLFLGYTAWRSSQAAQSADEPSAPPPAARDASPEPPAPNAKTSQPTTTPDTNKSPENAATQNSEPAASSAKAPSKADTGKSGASKESVGAVPEKASQREPTAATADNGSHELATAQQYLNGRDKAEAAKWLWKSISKHNGPATLQLADLYLRGDGVPKNCDQARVLLDSAARKGVAGAGERLRNLQAFGCQ